MHDAGGGGGGGGGSSWEGMNPDVVEAQARVLGGLSEEISTLVNKIEGEVTQLADVWHGDDSRKFAAEWAGTHKPVLTTAATLLVNMSETSQRNAVQQRATSSQ
jgi:WXG100 family type VII secretion target